MKLSRLLLVALLFCGCVQVSGTRKSDGTLSINTHRFFWQSEGINFTLKDTNNLSVTLSVQKSSVDSTALGAVAQGVAQGLAAGAKP
jgi:hypothetical protein